MVTRLTTQSCFYIIFKTNSNTFMVFKLHIYYNLVLVTLVGTLKHVSEASS